MKRDTIQVIPEFSETTARRQQSVKALKWLAWVSNQTGKNIRTALSAAGELRIGNYWVDGVVTDDNGKILEIWEFLGLAN